MREEPPPNVDLTKTDLELLGQIASRMIVAGIWHSIRHTKDVGCDCVEIHVVDSKHSTLTIGTLPGGRYFYIDRRTSAVHVGDTLGEILERAGLMVPVRHEIVR